MPLALMNKTTIFLLPVDISKPFWAHKISFSNAFKLNQWHGKE